MWPQGRWLPPLAGLTRREGAYSMVQFTMRSVSNWPHASLKGTHTTTLGEDMHKSMISFHSLLKLSFDSCVRFLSVPPL